MRSPLTSTSITIGRNPSSSIRPANSSAVTIQGPRVVAKSLPFAGPRRTFISRPWMSRADQSLKIVYPKTWPAASAGIEVASVGAGDPADDRAHLELEVQALGLRRAHLGAGRDDRVRVREVEGRELVPLVDHVARAVDRRGDALDVLLEGHEVAHARRHEGGEQLDLGERHGCRGIGLGREHGHVCEPGREHVGDRQAPREAHHGVADDEALADAAVMSPPCDPHEARSATCRSAGSSPAAFPDRIARSSASASPASRTRSIGSSTPMSNG